MKPNLTESLTPAPHTTGITVNNADSKELSCRSLCPSHVSWVQDQTISILGYNTCRCVTSLLLDTSNTRYAFSSSITASSSMTTPYLTHFLLYLDNIYIVSKVFLFNL